MSERDVPVRHLRCRGWRSAHALGVLADLLAGGLEDQDGTGERGNVGRAVAGLETVWVDAVELEEEEAREAMGRVERACRAAEIELVREGEGDQKSSLVSELFWARARKAT